MHRKGFFLIVCLVLGLSVRDASAQVGQSWIDRGYLNLNIAFGSSADTVSDESNFTIYSEPGTRSVRQDVDLGPIFDITAGSRVWRNVSVGVGYFRRSGSADAVIDASVPHPLFFDANRSVQGTAADLDRTEQAVYIVVGYMLPIDEKLSVHFTAGPGFFRLRQDVVSDVTFSEQSFPFATATAVPVISERSDSAAGIVIGADANYLFYDSDAYRIGAGAFIRWAGSSAHITVLDDEVDSDIGGFQIGFGARVRF